MPQLLLALVAGQRCSTSSCAGRTALADGGAVPNVTSVAAVAIVFGQLFGRDFGLINWLLDCVGVDADRLAGRTGSLVDRHLDDGRLALDRLQRADLPGRDAGHPARPLRVGRARRAPRRCRQFWRITVPMLRPTIIFTVIISTIGGLQLFAEPLLFNAGASAITGGSDCASSRR